MEPVSSGGKKLLKLILNNFDERLEITVEMLIAGIMDPQIKTNELFKNYLQDKKLSMPIILEKAFNKLNVEKNFDRPDPENQIQSRPTNIDRKDIFASSSDEESTTHSNIKQEVISYLAEPVTLNDDVLDFWKKKEFKYKRLSHVAKKYLGITAMSSDIESNFSTSGLIISARRSSLEPRKANMLIFLHQNMDRIEM